MIKSLTDFYGYTKYILGKFQGIPTTIWKLLLVFWDYIMSLPRYVKQYYFTKSNFVQGVSIFDHEKNT